MFAGEAEDLRTTRDRALLLVGFAAALRRSELVALRYQDVPETCDNPCHLPAKLIYAWTRCTAAGHDPRRPAIQRLTSAISTTLTEFSIVPVLVGCYAPERIYNTRPQRLVMTTRFSASTNTAVPA